MLEESLGGGNRSSVEPHICHLNVSFPFYWRANKVCDHRPAVVTIAVFGQYEKTAPYEWRSHCSKVVQVVRYNRSTVPGKEEKGTCAAVKTAPSVSVFRLL